MTKKISKYKRSKECINLNAHNLRSLDDKQAKRLILADALNNWAKKENALHNLHGSGE